MVKSISRVVQNLVEQDPPLQDALRRGYANYSSVARMLRPKVSEAVGKKVKLSGIATSVRRIKLELPDKGADINEVVAGSVLSVRTDVAKLSVEKTGKALKALQSLIDNFWSEFLQILIGSSSITIIMDQRAVAKAAASFDPGEVLDRKENLAALVIQSPEEIIDTPGCISVFYRALSRIGLNIEETVSCFTETIVLISMDGVGKALAALTELISTARAATNRDLASPSNQNRNIKP
ncbi:MAG: hypothetical protein WHS82_01120 [Candidatus Methanosuratincola sp.]